MSCPACGRENPPENAFCGACGTRLARVCPGCQRENPLDQSFCGRCGRSLEAKRDAGAQPEGVPSAFASGRYEVERFLGEGAKKRVYLARDTRLDREVAIGVIKQEGLDAEGRLRVQREARAMGRLGDHPHVVTVYDVAEEDGDLYLVCQYMGGGDLASRLAATEDRRLPIPETLRIAQELCHALEHAHAQGVIHRDLKPGNVWLTPEGQAKLGDFGLAVSLDRTRLTREGMMVGTAAYMAPEQALAKPPDTRSDLYGLGALLYELLTGRPPFAGDDAVAVISQHLNTPPVDPTWHNGEIPTPLEALVLRLLAKDPEQRPAGVREVREALTTIETVPATALAEERAGANPLDRLASGIFVGREPELAEARACLDQALSGHGRVLLLVGEPGIGKTRTAEELATYAHLRGAQVLWGHCYEGEGAPAYWPWVQMVRAYAHDHDPEELRSAMGSGAADIAEMVSQVRARLPELPRPSPVDPEQARFRLFDSVVSFLRNASMRRPLVLVLDDLHWADKPSLLLLQFLARELAGARLLVVGAYRDVELQRKHPLSETLAELAHAGQSDRILLRGLTRAEVGRFIERSAGVEPPGGLVDAVFRETEGNPFFVHEVVRLLAGAGRLQSPDAVGSWNLEIPQGVREVVGRRLNRLSDACNTILSVAAVIGRDFDFRVLREVSEQSEAQLLHALDEAIGARLVVESGNGALGRYRFTHALVQETLYDELSTPRRVLLHRQVGELLERIDRTSPEPHLSEIAHHFFQSVQSGDADRAVAYATRAGDWAQRRLAYEQAARHYEQALQVLELRGDTDPAERCGLLIRLAEVRGHAGDLPHGREAAVQAAELARGLESAELLARAALAYHPSWGMVAMGSVDSVRVGLLEESLASVGAEDLVLRARLLTALALELDFHPDEERARAVAAEAVGLARQTGDSTLLGWALQAYSVVGIGLDARASPSYKETFQEFRTVVRRVAETSSDSRLLQEVRAYSVADAFWHQDRAAMDASIEAEARLAEELRTPQGRYWPTLHGAMRALMDGDFEGSTRLADEALRIGERGVGGSNAVTWYGCWACVIVRQTGDRLDTAIRGFEEAVMGPTAIPAGRAMLAALYVARDERAKAQEQIEILAAGDFRDFPRDGNDICAWYLCAEVCVYLRDRSRATILYDLLLPFVDLSAGLGIGAAYVGTMARYLGLLGTLLERFEEAEGHFEEAVERESAMRSPPWLAQTRYGPSRGRASWRCSHSSRRRWLRSSSFRASTRATCRARSTSSRPRCRGAAPTSLPTPHPTAP
jgi:hypothetical protein